MCTKSGNSKCFLKSGKSQESKANVLKNSVYLGLTYIKEYQLDPTEMHVILRRFGWSKIKDVLSTNMEGSYAVQRTWNSVNFGIFCSRRGIS